MPYNLPPIFYTSQLSPPQSYMDGWPLSRFEFWPLNYSQILSGKEETSPVYVPSPWVLPPGLAEGCLLPGLQGRDDSERFLSWLLISVKMLLKEALSSSSVLTSLLQIKALLPKLTFPPHSPGAFS